MKQTLLLALSFISTSILLAQAPNQMLIGANNNGAIVSASLDGASPIEVITGADYLSFYNAAYHSGNGKVYLSWYYGIYSMDIDGGSLDTLYLYPPGGMGDGIDVDEINGYIYFTHSPLDSIYRMDLNGNNLTGIYSRPNISWLRDVELDLDNGHIYFSGSILGNGLFRIDINGTNEVVILGVAGVEYFYLDNTNSHIYYSRVTDFRRCDFNGSNDILLVSGFQIGGFDIDFSTNTIYITDMTNNKVKSSNLLGGDIVDLIQETDIFFDGSDPLESPQGIVLVSNCSTDNSVSQNSTTLTANQLGADYQWLDCDDAYSLISGENNQAFAPVITGNYAVEITLNGCVDTSSCLVITSLGIIENDFGDELLVFPNPTDGDFSIDLGAIYQSGKISIFDVSGKLIQSKDFSKTQQINTTINEPCGVYVVNIETKTKKAVIKLLKE